MKIIWQSALGRWLALGQLAALVGWQLGYCGFSFVGWYRCYISKLQLFVTRLVISKRKQLWAVASGTTHSSTIR
jgi:hypothetical protein